MRFNVSEVLKSPAGTERRYTFQEEERRFEEQAAEIRGAARLMRTDGGVLVMAEIETGVGTNCSRCLTRFVQPVRFEMAEEFSPTVDILSGSPLPHPADESFAIDSHHILDLGEAVGQYAMLRVPMKPLCSDDCRGLCQTCGTDLNQATCDCPTTRVESRWAKLEGLSLQLGTTSEDRRA